MMNGGMGSMMGWMSAGWLGGALLFVLLVAAVVVAAMRLLGGSDASPGYAGSIVLIVLAVTGALALAAALGIGVMHFGMMGGFR